MENKIYYGEYSLRHWIDLMLKKDIVLPEYQRSFVWDEKAVKKFVKSLKDKQFIPPVTIAHYKIQNDVNETNLILDGQQRLTSLLLAAIGFYPDKKKFEDSETVIASDDDSENDDSETDIEKKKSIEWTFEKLLKNENSTIDNIKENINSGGNYTHIKGLEVDDDFFDDTFLGFSYIVPTSEDKNEVQKSFSKTFREINYFGKSLSAQESRRSLYFMNDEYKDFLDGKTDQKDVLCSLTINENMLSKKIDFIRYLSILSQLKIQGSAWNVLKYYSSYASREMFYVDYVSFIVGLEQENHIEKFDGCEMINLFPNNCWKERFKELHKIILSLPKKIQPDEKVSKVSFDSWIDADYYLFGLIYYVLFEDKKIDFTDKLFKEIRTAINEKRGDKNSAYSRSPNRLGNLRDRLNESVDIYSKYVE